MSGPGRVREDWAAESQRVWDEINDYRDDEELYRGHEELHLTQAQAFDILADEDGLEREDEDLVDERELGAGDA